LDIIIICGDVDALEVLLRRHHNLVKKVMAKHGDILFSSIFRRHHYTIMKMLASHCITPCLHFAAERGDTKAAAMLILELNYSVRGRDSDHRTPLHTAAGHGNIAMVELLVDRFDASTSAIDKYGQTPLAYAVSRKKNNVIKWLVDIGANINIPDKQGWTPLHDAVNIGDIDTIKILAISLGHDG
jgi:ankyrin repeat protein